MRRGAVAVTILGAVLVSTAAGRSRFVVRRTSDVARRTATTTWDSVYSATQSTRGETAYVKACARCHLASLAGADQSPPLLGSGFLGNWNGLPLSDLHDRVRTTMPPDSIGLYDRQFVTDVIAYLLKANGFPAGAVDLPAEADRLKTITIQATRP